MDFETQNPPVRAGSGTSAERSSPSRDSTFPDVQASTPPIAEPALDAGNDVTVSADSPSRPCKPCDPCEVTNNEFIASVFHALPEGARQALVSFSGDPNAVQSAAWFARPWDDREALATANNYFGISSYFNSEAGEFRRTKKTFAALHCLMLDDLGSKIAIDRIALPLSWLIETSPGNYQGGYILEAPIEDASAADRLMNAVIGAGLCDPGANGPTTRLARLPQGINGKSNPPFGCRIVEWNPALRYTPDQIVDGLGLDLAPAGRPKSSRKRIDGSGAKAVTDGPGHSHLGDEVLMPRPAENVVITAMKSRGFYKQPLGGGKHDVTCPWVSEHTAAVDGGSAYFEPDDGFPLGGFKCHHSHGDRLHIRDLLTYLGVQPSAAKMKPTLRVVPGEIHRIVDGAEQQLAATGHYYQSGGLIATVRTDPASNETAIAPCTPPALLRALSRAAIWERFDLRSDEWVTCDPPARHCTVLFDAGSYPHLPILRGIARQPHLRDDGTVVTESGYDPLTGRFGVFDARAFCIPAKPSRADAEAALRTLRSVLGEVAFDQPVDEAAALSGMLTAAVRAALPTAPGYHVQAHSISSGKSFLNRIISILATPENVAGIAFPGDADEMRKTLIALLVKSPAVINFDDLNGDIVPSEALKTALTEEFIGGRILGISKDVVCSTRTLFLFSGNNVGPVRDMTRRIVTVHLDPRIENPVSRTFKNPDLESDSRKSRAVLVSAALTIIRAWLVAGSPRTPVKPLASYGRWSDLCRQPLLWLGLPDAATRVFEQVSNDPDTELLGRLMSGWDDAFGNRPILVRELKRMPVGEFYDTLCEIASVRGDIDPARLGWWIKRNSGRIVGGLKIERVPSARGAAAWRVVQGSQGSQGPSGPPAETVSDEVLL